MYKLALQGLKFTVVPRVFTFFVPLTEVDDSNRVDYDLTIGWSCWRSFVNELHASTVNEELSGFAVAAQKHQDKFHWKDAIPKKKHRWVKINSYKFELLKCL